MIEPGTKFARLTVLSKDEAASALAGRLCYACLCSCGARTVVRGGNLKSGGQKSCGCLRRENARSGGRNNPRSKFSLSFYDGGDE